MAVPLARGVTPAVVTLRLPRLAWLIEVRGLADRSEGLGWPGPVDKCEGSGWAGRAQGPSIKVRALGGRAGPGPVDKWHACPGSYNKFIHFATHGTHGQPRRIGTIKDECVGRAMLGVEVIALGDGTLVDRYMMIAFNQMYWNMGDQGFAILAGESFGEFCCCVLNAMNAKNSEL